MTETSTEEIKVLDLADKLTEYLAQHRFVRLSLDALSPFDSAYFIQRDKREHGLDVGLSTFQKWRSDEDYLVFDNNAGTLTYIRPNPNAQITPHAVPYEIHVRTAAPDGLTRTQYFSLAVPQRNLSLLLEALHKKGYTSISHIGEMNKFGVLSCLTDQLDCIDKEELPAHLFHSVYVSQKREAVKELCKENAINEITAAIGSVIISSHLFSRKQIEYYKATAEVDKLF